MPNASISKMRKKEKVNTASRTVTSPLELIARQMYSQMYANTEKKAVVINVPTSSIFLY